MTDLESIRRQKIAELQKSQQNAVEQDFIHQQLEGAKKTVLQRFLTKEARERLATVKIAAQAGQIQGQITEEQLREILNRASGSKKEFNIIR